MAESSGTESALCFLSEIVSRECQNLIESLSELVANAGQDESLPATTSIRPDLLNKVNASSDGLPVIPHKDLQMILAPFDRDDYVRTEEAPQDGSQINGEVLDLQKGNDEGISVVHVHYAKKFTQEIWGTLLNAEDPSPPSVHEIQLQNDMVKQPQESVWKDICSSADLGEAPMPEDMEEDDDVYIVWESLSGNVTRRGRPDDASDAPTVVYEKDVDSSGLDDDDDEPVIVFENIQKTSFETDVNSDMDEIQVCA